MNQHALKIQLTNLGIDYYKRQTGRTHRMFEAAVYAVNSGRSVTVLMKDEKSAEDWRGRGWEIPGLEIINLHAKDLSGDESRVDWKNMRMKDHRANNKLFIDHDVIYSRFKEVLVKFTQFDNVVAAVPHHVVKSSGIGALDYEMLLDAALDNLLGTTEEGVVDSMAEVRKLVKNELFMAYSKAWLADKGMSTTVLQKAVANYMTGRDIADIVERTLDVIFANKALPSVSEVVKIKQEVIRSHQQSLGVNRQVAPACDTDPDTQAVEQTAKSNDVESELDQVLAVLTDNESKSEANCEYLRSRVKTLFAQR
jgi:hypothetical protein